MRNALISVYNKEGIDTFARDLSSLGWKIYASGGTAKLLSEKGIQVNDVASIVGGEAILGHRVVTLSREIHAGILARDNEEDAAELQKIGAPRIDLVCVDTYPLEETIDAGGSISDVIEKTDVGGPTMLSAAAKAGRLVVSNATDRGRVIAWLKQGEPERDSFIQSLRANTYDHLARYFTHSARYHGAGSWDSLSGTKVGDCKYGENPYMQPAAVFQTSSDKFSPSSFKQVEGDAPSFINWTDIDRLLQTMTHIGATFEKNISTVPPIAVGVKHGNACGASAHEDAVIAVKLMIEGDPQALFGGFVMLNMPVSKEIAEALSHHQSDSRRIIDGVVAPSFDEEAIEVLARKGGRCKLLAHTGLLGAGVGIDSLDKVRRVRPIRGGFLAQPNYTYVHDWKHPDLVIHGDLSVAQKSDLALAWAVGSTSNSNTITLVKDGKVIGNGAGQQSRVGAAKLALMRAHDAGHDPKDAVAYSDSFFPFPDGPMVLADAGIAAILSTSGSIKDPEVIKAIRDAGVSIALIPDKLGRGFYQH